MATQLNKVVRRQLASVDRKGRPLIVTLSPGDIISFRPKGAKRTISIYIGHVFQLAQLNTIEQEYGERMKVYKADRAAGRKRRRPNKPTLFYSKIYFDAMK